MLPGENQLNMDNSRDDLNWIASKRVWNSTNCQISPERISVTQDIDKLVFIVATGISCCN